MTRLSATRIGIFHKVIVSAADEKGNFLYPKTSKTSFQGVFRDAPSGILQTEEGRSPFRL